MIPRAFRPLALWGAFLISPTLIHAQSLSDLPTWEKLPPEKPNARVWLEGEAFVKQEGGSAVNDAECYGGKSWNVYGGAGAYAVEYAFALDRAGTWLLSAAGQPVGTGYTSPIRLILDGNAPVLIEKAPASSVSWGAAKAVRWTHLLVTNLSAGEHRLRIEVAGKRAMDDKWAYRIDALALVHEPFAGIKLPFRLASGQTSHVFTTATPVVFRTERPAGERTLEYRVTDFLGEELSKGAWKTSQPLSLPDLAPGYYRLWHREPGANAWEAHVPFARVIDPSRRSPNPDSPYCVDTAQSWLSKDRKHPLFPTNAYALTSDLVKLAGLTMVRDRMSWNQVNPETNVFLWTNMYSTNAELLAARGVKVLSVYHDAPKWAKGRLTSMPEDLFALYEFSRRMVKQWGRMIPAWEFWNEQDISFCKDPAWDFAAAQKAAFLGYKAGDPKANVLIGSSAQGLPLPRFFEVLFENGVADYFDTFNFHIYRELPVYDALIADVTNVLTRYGAAHHPSWVTENGLSHEGAGKMKPLVEGRTELEHDEAQERLQAEHLVKTMIMVPARGIERVFFFVFPPYNERDNTKAWGMFRFDMAVKPAYAALANLTHQLGDARYLGRFDAGEGIESYLFEDPKVNGARQVLVWWSASNDTRPMRLRDEAKKAELVDMNGKAAPIAPAGGAFALTAGRYPQYLRGLSGLKPSLPPVRLPPPPMAARDLEVVLRFTPGDGFTVANKLSAKLEKNPARASIDVFNFSSKEKQVTLRSRGEGYTLTGLDKPVRVPPMASVPVPITLKSATVNPFALVVDGLSGGKECAPFHIPLYLDMRSRDDVEARSIDILRPDRWRKNSAGELDMDVDGDALRFAVKFPPGVDRWVYPELPLDLPKEGLAGAIGIGFEVRSEKQSSKEFHCLLMAVYEALQEKGKAQFLPYATQTTNWQTVLIQFASEAPASFDPSAVKMLRIGCNPPLDKWTYWVRNLKVYYRK